MRQEGREEPLLPDMPGKLYSTRAEGGLGQGDTVNRHQDGRLSFHLVIGHGITDVAGDG